MREVFKANITVGFSHIFSSHRLDCCTLPLKHMNWREGQERRQLALSKRLQFSQATWRPVQAQSLFIVYLDENAVLKLGRKQVSRAQTTDGMLAFTIQSTGGWNVGDTIWESPQCHFWSTSCVVHGQKAGRVSGCQRTKGACMHESSYHWQTPGLAKSEQWSPKIHIYAEGATNFPPWWKHDEENLSDRFTAGFNPQAEHI